MKKFDKPRLTGSEVAYTISEGGRYFTGAIPDDVHSIIYASGMRWDEHNGWNEERLTLDEVEYIRKIVREIESNPA